MPHALSIDRELVKSLYLAGFTPLEINAKTGVKVETLKTWSKRFQWGQMRAIVKAQGEPAQVEERRLTVRDQAQALLSNDLSLISSAKIKSARGALDRQARLEPWVRNARTVFGWNEGSGPSTLVNINVLSSKADPPSPIPMTGTEPSAITNAGAEPITELPPK